MRATRDTTDAFELSLKERRFVDAYLGSANGNATKAARQAGYGSTAKSSSVLGARLLGKVSVRRAIENRLARATRASVMSADARDVLLSDIARNPKADVRDRIRAIAELNKVTGRHSIKHTVAGRLTLADALEASWRL